MDNNDFIVELKFSLLQEIGTLINEASINLPQKYVDSVRSKLNSSIQDSHAKLQREKLEAEQKAKEEADKAE
jgi:ElaB/YqjD/DUF883 family membrane-anchored ribosome-binding protein